MSVDTPSLPMKDIDLVPFEQADVDAQYGAWLHDLEVIRLLEVARQNRSKEALLQYVTAVISDPDRHFFKIVAREASEKIGTISLHVNQPQGLAHYGYLLGEREYWGGNFALQAQVGLFDFAFGTLKVRKIAGGACTENIGSNFNFSRLGFKREGIRKAHVLVGTEGDETADVAEYGCLAAEWAENSVKFNNFRSF